MENDYRKKILVIGILALGIVLLGGLSFYTYNRITTRFAVLSGHIQNLSDQVASTTRVVSEKMEHLSKDIEDLDRRLTEASGTLSTAEKNIESTKKNVETVQTKVGGVEQTVGQISGTVNTLEKLTKTDPELLQKYSKIFFLNEHYIPARLVEIDLPYLYSEKKPEQIHALVWPRLGALLDTAKADGMMVYIKSGYRSFKEQSAVKSSYTVIYGPGTASQFSADQGYSEHQLGTTVDFITPGLGGGLSGFDKTPAYQWLVNNAHRYGFILSYYEGNPYYIFEPWHWRYVGVALATYLHDTGKHFYDLDQREIDAYLANIFD